MATQAFINLAVKHLEKTRNFFSKLGFPFNEQFSNEKAVCMIINENCFVMLLAEPFFQSFTSKVLVDAHKGTEVLMGISADKKENVDSLLDKALAMGAKEDRPAQDHGFMYSRSFHDLDGHIWEVFWMDMSAFPQH